MAVRTRRARLARTLIDAIRADEDLHAELSALLVGDLAPRENGSSWLTVREPAEHLRINERTVQRLEARGHIRSTTIGRRRLYQREDLDALAATGEGSSGNHSHPACADSAGVRSHPDRRKPRLSGDFLERMKGLEPSTFCMASRRSSQLSYIRLRLPSIAGKAARTSRQNGIESQRKRAGRRCRQPRDCVDSPAGPGQVSPSPLRLLRAVAPGLSRTIAPCLRSSSSEHETSGDQSLVTWPASAGTLRRSRAATDSLERLAAEVDGALTITGDVRMAADVQRAFAEARARFETVDLVVVAISPTQTGRTFGGGEVADLEPTALSPYLDDLLPGLLNVLRVGARVLREQGHGTYVQVTGGSARRGMPGRGPWAAAAFATRGLVQAAASELREHGVHVALLIVDATIESEKTRARLEGKPSEASTSEEDVAAAIAYLADQSSRGWTHELQITPAGDRWLP